MYLAMLGRQPELSLAELEALFSDVQKLSSALANFNSDTAPEIARLGGALKIAVRLEEKPLDLLLGAPEGKITIGISDYSCSATRHTAAREAMKLKKSLVARGRSVRIVQNTDKFLSTATSLHNGLSGANPRKIEFIKVNQDWFRVIGVQDVDAYARRDQARPARDAKVGMLPPKLAQILINLCGPLPPDARLLDPFCGTGVVLQEALLMGYSAYGTDINERMVEYTRKNLEWLLKSEKIPSWGANSRRQTDANKQIENQPFQISVGDATNFSWDLSIDAVACECFLGAPMSKIPTELVLKEQKQFCKNIILKFLENLAPQIKKNTPIVIAIPAWLRVDGTYSRIKIVDKIEELGYNVNNKSRGGLLYHREGQVVARDIIILRKD